MNNRIVFDLDGVICTQPHGDLSSEKFFEMDVEERFSDVEPIETGIELVKKEAGKGNEIIIYTARREESREITEEWLKEHDVPYDELILGKPVGDIYIDDKAVPFGLYEQKVLKEGSDNG